MPIVKPSPLGVSYVLGLLGLVAYPQTAHADFFGVDTSSQPTTTATPAASPEPGNASSTQPAQATTTTSVVPPEPGNTVSAQAATTTSLVPPKPGNTASAQAATATTQPPSTPDVAPTPGSPSPAQASPPNPAGATTHPNTPGPPTQASPPNPTGATTHPNTPEPPSPAQALPPNPTSAAPQPPQATTHSNTPEPSQDSGPTTASEPIPEPRIKLRGYGGPLVKLTLLNRQFGALIGLRGGILLGKRVSLGAALHYLMLPVEIDPQQPDPVRSLNLNYAGAAIGVMVAEVRDRLQFELLTLVGGGGACWQNRTQGTCEDRTAFFVAEPEFYMHINVVKYFRISVGAGYRFVAAGAWSGPGSWRLAGPVGTIMLAFGKF